MTRSATRYVCVLVALLAFVAGADAQPKPRALDPEAIPLPAEVDVPFKKGLMAAGIPDYPLAIRHFEDAVRAAGSTAAPVAYFNLGVAESKIAGREARAIAWFGAYLASAPSTTKRAAVLSEIETLSVRLESLVSQVVRQAQEVHQATWAGKRPVAGSYDCMHGFETLVEFWARIGDAQAAWRAAEAIPGCQESMESLRGKYVAGALSKAARVLAEEDQLAKAIETAARIKEADDPEALAEALVAIGRAQTSQNKAAAKATLASAHAVVTRSEQSETGSKTWLTYTLDRLVQARAEADDIVGARATLDRLNARDRQRRPGLPEKAIALAQARSGDVTGAIQTAATSKEVVSVMKDAASSLLALRRTQDFQVVMRAWRDAALRLPEPDRSGELRWIVSAYEDAGDASGAAATAGLMSKTDWQVLNMILRAQAKGGDAAGARATAARHTDEFHRENALKDLVGLLVLRGDISEARATAVTAGFYRSGSLGEIIQWQMAKGDTQAALATAALEPEASSRALRHRDIAVEQLARGDAAGARATLALIPAGLVQQDYLDLLALQRRAEAYQRSRAMDAEPPEFRRTWLETLTSDSPTVTAGLRRESDSHPGLAGPLFTDAATQIRSLSGSPPAEVFRQLAIMAGRLTRQQAWMKWLLQQQLTAQRR